MEREYTEEKRKALISRGGLNYKLKDYLKCGTPLAALLCMMSILVLPMMFPLYYLQ